jgi:hypothetical protein
MVIGHRPTHIVVAVVRYYKHMSGTQPDGAATGLTAGECGSVDVDLTTRRSFKFSIQSEIGYTCLV